MTKNQAQREYEFVLQIRQQVEAHGVAKVAAAYAVPEYVVEGWLEGRPRFHRFPLYELGRKID